MKKERTWPYAVVEHPGTAPGEGLWNIRKLDGLCLLVMPETHKPAAVYLRDALNEAFDLGREDRR